MLTHLRTLFLFAVCGFAGMSAAMPGLAAEDAHPVIRLGVSDLSDGNPNKEIMAASIAYLQREYDGKIEVVHFSVEGLVEAIRQGLVDITMSSAGLYRASATYGAKDLVSSAFDQGRDPNHCSASLFLVRADRTDLKNLKDLKGKRAVATRPLSITGLVMALGELESQGYDSDEFFSSIDYTGYPMSDVIDAVVEGRADVGLLWACYYEELLAAGYPNIDKVRPFATKSGDSLRCLHSTDTYPGYTTAVTPLASPEIARFVTQSLLAMPKTSANGYFWTISTDFHALDKLFRQTRYGPYSYLRQWTLQRVWDEHRLAIVLVVVAVLFWAFHSIRTNQLVRERTRQLQSAMQRQRVLQADARAQSERLQALERLGAIEQLSSMLAHELKQPLTACGYYLDSLISRQQRGMLESGVLLKTLEKIRELNHRSNDLINHVRRYAKKTNVIREPILLSEAIKAAVNNLTQAQVIGPGARVSLELESGVMFTADRLEIELIVLNLVKNALQAASGVEHPVVRVTLSCIQSDGRAGVLISVVDNGPTLTDEAFVRLTEPFHSTRAGGLGLGIAIVGRLAESYGGRVRFSRLAQAGLRCEVSLFEVPASKVQ